MKRLLLFSTLFSLQVAVAQPPDLQKKAVTMWRVVQKRHYKPPANDAVFGERVFNGALANIDRYNLLFTSDDIKTLAPFKATIASELDGKSWGFADALTKLYTARVQFVDSVMMAMLAKPINFSQKQQLDLNEAAPRSANTLAQVQRVQQYTKWLLLRQMEDEYDGDSLAPTKAEMLKAEEAARKALTSGLQKQLLKRKSKPDAAALRVATLYLKTIAEAVDPHTAYLPPKEKDDFDAQLSSEQELFGFSLEQDKDGELKIAGLVPGSSAWNSGDVHEDDALVQVKTAQGVVINVGPDNVDSLNAVFDNADNQQLTLTLRSSDGKVKNVPLQKEVVRNDENIVKGYLLKGAQNVGYIQLPSFYTKWSGSLEGTSCANDVAQEIVKLKAENIAGLILDLRYNGGGSVREAIDLSGIFIDGGPMCVVRGGDMKAEVLKDQNRGTIFNGPLAVMINGQSASASELVAGTLQDYHRAVIVGSNSFGKATGQNIYPIDTTATDTQEETELSKTYGYVKTTVGKLYRVTGKTSQLNGVVPDVTLPDGFGVAEDYTERSLKYALPSDTVMKTIYYTPLPALPIAALAASSASRVSQAAFFKQLTAGVALIKQQADTKQVPLNIDDYIKWRTQSNALGDSDMDSDRISAKTSAYKVMQSGFNKKSQLTALSVLEDYVLEDLEEDAYIEETYHILIDLINKLK